MGSRQRGGTTDDEQQEPPSTRNDVETTAAGVVDTVDSATAASAACKEHRASAPPTEDKDDPTMAVLEGVLYEGNEVVDGLETSSPSIKECEPSVATDEPASSALSPTASATTSLADMIRDMHAGARPLDLDLLTRYTSPILSRWSTDTYKWDRQALWNLLTTFFERAEEERDAGEGAEETILALGEMKARLLTMEWKRITIDQSRRDHDFVDRASTLLLAFTVLLRKLPRSTHGVKLDAHKVLVGALGEPEARSMSSLSASYQPALIGFIVSLNVYSPGITDGVDLPAGLFDTARGMSSTRKSKSYALVNDKPRSRTRNILGEKSRNVQSTPAPTEPVPFPTKQLLQSEPHLPSASSDYPYLAFAPTLAFFPSRGGCATPLPSPVTINRLDPSRNFPSGPMSERVVLWRRNGEEGGPRELVVKVRKRLGGLEEAEVMVYMARSTSIPVPKIHALDTFSNKEYLYMSALPGLRLDHPRVWPCLSASTKISLQAEVAGCVSEYSELPAPPGALLGTFGEPFCRPICSFNPSTLPLDRPSSPSSLFRWIGHILADPPYTICKRPQDIESFPFPSSPSSLPVAFAHGDFAARNLLVNPETGKLAGLIDWDRAGFWPQGVEETLAEAECKLSSESQEETDFLLGCLDRASGLRGVAVSRAPWLSSFLSIS